MRIGIVIDISAGLQVIRDIKHKKHDVVGRYSAFQ
jgi:hypothetical protein